MGWLSELAGRRLDAVSAKRLGLVDEYLRPDERVLHNAPAERVVLSGGQVETEPVILFATNERFLIIPYDGSGAYAPVYRKSDDKHIEVRLGRYFAFPTRPARGAAGAWKGLGALIVDHEQMRTMPPTMASSLLDLRVAADAAGSSLGPFGRETIEHLREFLSLTNERCALIALPFENERLGALVSYVDANSTFKLEH